MNIRDAQGGLPTTAIATFSKASYVAVAVPATPGTMKWTIPGADPGALILGADDANDVTVQSAHRSVTAGDIQLVATFTPTDGTPPTVATLALTVFAAEIQDANGLLLPIMDIGVGNHAQYTPVITPVLPITRVSWLAGANGRIAIAAQSPTTGEVDVVGQTVSVQGRDGLLTLTIQVGLQQATTAIGIGVFGVRIAIDRFISWVGVGEVAVCSAEVVPAGTLPPGATATTAWAVTDKFQIMGDRTKGKASLVANAASGSIDDDRVSVALTWQGSTVRARRALTAIGVAIRGADGGEPPLNLVVGTTTTYLAVMQPTIEDALVYWMGGRTATVQQDGFETRVTGVLPSDFEGADGLSVHVFAGPAVTQALIPLTVVALSTSTG